MKSLTLCLLGLFSTSIAFASHTAPQNTARESLLENKAVKVWKTTILPSKEQELSPHRHDRNRVVIALTDGKLKVVSSQGKIHYLNLKAHHAYYLEKDIPAETHTDENITTKPIQVIVVELKS